MKSLISREWIRRLEIAAREKKKDKLYEWIISYEDQLNNILRREYEKAYQDELHCSIQNTFIAIAYTAYYSEESYIDKKNIADFMSDLFTTIDMFRTGEYRPEEYKEILAKENVFIDDYDYDKIYKKFLNMYDTDLVRYLRGNPRKIITICGDRKYNNEILDKYKELSVQGNIVFIPDFHKLDELIIDEIEMFNKLLEDKILLSNELYVINIDKELDDNTKLFIKYAKEHNKDIKYLNKIDEIKA